MRFFLFIISIFLFFGCNSIRETRTSSTQPAIDVKVEISESAINFILKNTSQKNVFIYSPRKIKIQKFENNEWRSLKILYCPCDAPCNAPEEKVLISVGEFLSIPWNKKESWCGDRNHSGMRVTEEYVVTTGLYRFNYSLIDSIDKIEKYIEFEIK